MMMIIILLSKCQIIKYKVYSHLLVLPSGDWRRLSYENLAVPGVEQWMTKINFYRAIHFSAMRSAVLP